MAKCDAADLIATLRRRLGEDAVLTGDAAAQAGFSFWTRTGTPQAVVRPATTQEVGVVLAAADAAHISITPWGGLTGLVGGAFADGGVALSLSRMKAIEAIDPDGSTMTVQAGCVLEDACQAASAAGLFLPLDLGSRGSATIGGVLSTNAGGNRVLRYGMARDMTLGLEAVLADGTIVSSMNRLIKNNAGYDLKHLFVGSEGTLGVITRAVLRLRPAPVSQEVALLAVDSFAALPAILRRLERELPGTLSAFEVVWPAFYTLVTTAPAQGRAPLPHGSAFYVLVEAMGGDAQRDRAQFESALAGVVAEGQVADAVIAKSQAERQRLWALRDDVAQTARNGPISAFDVSLPVSEMEAYLDEVRQALEARWPAASLTVFGHLGDGNLHLIVGGLEPADKPELEVVIYAPLGEAGGSISAEHGIGLEKRAHLGRSRSEAERALMRRLKDALDPNGVLNPGKIFEPAP
jgi:FAD/FMN-containing dehydrogenase